MRLVAVLASASCYALTGGLYYWHSGVREQDAGTQTVLADGADSELQDAILRTRYQMKGPESRFAAGTAEADYIVGLTTQRLASLRELVSYNQIELNYDQSLLSAVMHVQRLRQ